MLRKTFAELNNYLASVQLELKKPAPIICHSSGGNFRRTFLCFKELTMYQFSDTGLLVDKEFFENQRRFFHLFDVLRNLDPNAPRVELSPKLYLTISDDSLDLVPEGGLNEIPLINDTEHWTQWLSKLPQSILDQELIFHLPKLNFSANNVGFPDGFIGRSALYFFNQLEASRCVASRSTLSVDGESKPGESIYLYLNRGHNDYGNNEFA